MFLGIWVNYLTDRKMIITGLVSGLLAILLSQIVPYKLHIVLATLAASGAACYITERHAGGLIMSAEYVWGAIFIMMGVTYISRIIPFLLLAGKPVPRWFKTWLTYVPTAIFGALVLPDVFLPAGSLNLGLNNLYLWSTVIIFPLVYKTKSLGLAIVSGAAVFALLQAVL